MFPFYTPWEHQENSDFLFFQGKDNMNIGQKLVK